MTERLTQSSTRITKNENKKKLKLKCFSLEWSRLVIAHELNVIVL